MEYREHTTLMLCSRSRPITHALYQRSLAVHRTTTSSPLAGNIKSESRRTLCE